MALRLLSLLLWLLLSRGCTTVPVVTDYVDADLNGQINGKVWLYKHAYTDPTVKTPNEDDVVFVFLPYVPKDKCPKSQDDAPDHRSVMVAAPQEANKQVKLKAGTQRNLVFQYDDKTGAQVATSAKRGKIKVLSIEGDKVIGKVYAKAGTRNWVSGNFIAVVCNSLDLR